MFFGDSGELNVGGLAIFISLAGYFSMLLFWFSALPEQHHACFAAVLSFFPTCRQQKTRTRRVFILSRA